MTYLIKILIFAFFLTIVYFSIDYMLDLVRSSFVDSDITTIMCIFGIFDALNVYFSILATGFLYRQILNFWK
jgi:TRAP-type C4-dicarboxylate transport system permease small subunit